MNHENIISYSLEEFMSYRDVNGILPQYLEKYCGTVSFARPSVNVYSVQLNEIITAITQGQDPNDINIKNLIKYHIGLLDYKNYTAQLERLKQLQITSKSNCVFLASELMKCIVKCQLSVKGFVFKNDNEKSVPEVCADICKEYSIYSSKQNESLNFTTELLRLSRENFERYTNDDISMDENNNFTSDNYKGFMTFMGLMYSRHIIGLEIVISCLTKIKDTLFQLDKNGNYKRTQYECGNYYKGYDFLLSHVNNHLQNTINQIIEKYTLTANEDTKKCIDKMCEQLNKLILLHNEIIELNQKQPSGKCQLKGYNVVSHNKSGDILNMLLTKLSKYHNYDTIYIKAK
jgi:hypothetical protein